MNDAERPAGPGARGAGTLAAVPPGAGCRQESAHASGGSDFGEVHHEEFVT